MLKVMTIVGTRPEVIRLSRTIPLLDSTFDHNLVHTGQNFDYHLNQIFFKELGIREPDVYLNAAGSSAAETIGNVISKIDRELERIQPDAVLILGDTNSALCAISAKRRKIPIFHLEAGNRSFDQRVPEEINRKIVDHISDINLTYSTIAREYLLREGADPDRVIKVGSPMFEVIKHYDESIISSEILRKLSLTKGEYFLVSAHREENIDPAKMFNQLVNTLNKLAEDFGLPVVVSTHPRFRKRIDDAQISFNDAVRFVDPFGFVDYISLQKNALAVLSDSGTITEEASILGFTALNLREAHERPEGMEETTAMLVGVDYKSIKQALKLLQNQSWQCQTAIRPVSDYLVENFSLKIVRIIQSYTDYENRVVWKKY